MGKNPPVEQGDDSRNLAIYVGDRVSTLREALGLNTNELAKSSGVAYSHLAQVERGSQLPGLKTMLRLIRPLGVASIDELLGGTNVLLRLHSKDAESS